MFSTLSRGSSVQFIPYSGPPMQAARRVGAITGSPDASRCPYPISEPPGSKSSLFADTDGFQAAKGLGYVHAVAEDIGSRSNPIEVPDNSIIHEVDNDDDDASLDETAAAILDALRDANMDVLEDVADACEDEDIAPSLRPIPQPQEPRDSDSPLLCVPSRPSSCASESTCLSPKGHAPHANTIENALDGEKEEGLYHPAAAKWKVSLPRSGSRDNAASSGEKKAAHHSRVRGLEAYASLLQQSSNTKAKIGITAAPAAKADTDQQYEFRQILQKRRRSGRTEYLVAWEDSWVWKDDLIHATEALAEFCRERKVASKIGRSRKKRRTGPSILNQNVVGGS